MSSEYKSPTHKILKFLKIGRDKWKAKTISVKYDLKKLKQQLNYAHQKIDQLTAELNLTKNKLKKTLAGGKK